VNKRLLIIDDEQSVLFALRRYFQRRGFTVQCARELEEAEALMSTCAFDLAIVDLSLTANGSTEGLEFLRYVRRYRPHARLILLTGFADAGIEAEAARRGVDALIHKPKPLSEIARIVDRLLKEAA
jgi:two-component system, response regulator RegA